MAQQKAISGFSKMSASEKIQWLKEVHDLAPGDVKNLEQHLHPDEQTQQTYAEFSENTISNFFIPFGLAPNFLVNGKWYVLPMAIEESSVVAAASHAAKFWSAYGGFQAKVEDTVKVGQVHFFWTGEPRTIQDIFKRTHYELQNSVSTETVSMRKRGGGLINLQLINQTDNLENYYQLHAEFRTADAMGANFINTVLEKLAKEWKRITQEQVAINHLEGAVEISMAILSNYTPDCLVKVWVETETGNLGGFDAAHSGEAFAKRFVQAVNVAKQDTHRAVTHNKGIFNGMDSVIIATGNDFRAVEACGHAFAARDGIYRSLSSAEIRNGKLRFELKVPLAIGTVGGLTTGHPMARTSLKLLGDPSAEELMMIVAAAGLANNFSAVRSLITGGIQEGHMKMHLANILRQLDATEKQKSAALAFFKDRTISYSAVKSFISEHP